MLKPYRTVQDVLSSPWAQVQRVKRSPQQTDRVLRSTKLEDSIYRDLRMEDTGMDEIENSAGEKLRSFPALSRDIFQSFYSLMPRRNADDDLSVPAMRKPQADRDHLRQFPAGNGGNQTECHRPYVLCPPHFYGARGYFRGLHHPAQRPE